MFAAHIDPSEIPDMIDCPNCGMPAGQDKKNPPEIAKHEPYKTHLAYVKERRTADEAKALLDEALSSIRERRVKLAQEATKQAKLQAAKAQAAKVALAKAAAAKAVKPVKPAKKTTTVSGAKSVTKSSSKSTAKSEKPAAKKATKPSAKAQPKATSKSKSTAPKSKLPTKTASKSAKKSSAKK